MVLKQRTATRFNFCGPITVITVAVITVAVITVAVITVRSHHTFEQPVDSLAQWNTDSQ